MHESISVIDFYKLYCMDRVPSIEGEIPQQEAIHLIIEDSCRISVAAVSAVASHYRAEHLDGPAKDAEVDRSHALIDYVGDQVANLGMSLMGIEGIFFDIPELKSRYDCYVEDFYGVNATA